ncbi:MAG: serine/threonine-protein kinase [Acidobacteria bacterium]|nr:serine/threonine-protein kinase [Acidobacteriota bacterium]
MPLTPGSRVGVYEIIAPIGAGGMGEVYRARDARLNRDVAIKILPPLFAEDPERLARFEREAQVLASLNHPNIAQIYGIAEAPADNARPGEVERPALVMELVEGDDLAVHIARGPLPLNDAIQIARQIADALDCAHELGIVHRDLKPANIKIRTDGTVKVLDFGLAKLAEPPSGFSSSALLSPTLTSPATQLGVILGTAAYMAPEQARGKPVDKRADVWGFGVVLYEMLTGRRAFEGSEVSDTLAFILTKDPDWSALPAGTPPAVRRLLSRCLQKERKQRLADMSDARLELEEALGPVPADQAPAASPVVSRSRWFVPAIAAAIVAALVVGGVAALKLFRPVPPPPPVVRFSVPLAEGVEFSNPGRHVVAVSPDGQRIVFVANRQLYLREVNSTRAEAIPGSGATGSAVGPVFSPDGQSIVYYSDGALRRIGVGGGSPSTLATLQNPFGVNWSGDTLLVAQGPAGIARIPADGGNLETIIKVGAGEIAQGPQMLPGAEWIIFTLASGQHETRWDKAKIVAHSVRSGERRVLIDGGGDVRYASTGHLLYAVSGVVFAVPFDAATMTLKGAARPVLEGVRRTGLTGASHFAVSPNGTLVYVEGGALTGPSERRLGFLDRAGKVTEIPLPPGGYETPRVSPDGTRLAVTMSSDTDADIWIYDLAGTSAIRRLTFGGKNRYPLWSPDGRQIVFQSDREGDLALYLQSADISGAASRLTKADVGTAHAPTSWSSDGQWVAMWITSTAAASSISIVSLKDRTVRPFHTPAATDPIRAGSGEFSPDGKWLAYHGIISSNNVHIYVEPFPATGARYQIHPGVHPAWSADGRELVISPFGPGFLQFSIVTDPRFTFSRTGEVRREGVTGGWAGAVRNYDVTRDGKRLLVVLRGATPPVESREIQVVLNWFAELKTK